LDNVIFVASLTRFVDRGKTWTGEYITDYSEILASVEEEGNNDDEGKTALDEVREGGKRNEDEPRLSLVDGKLKPNLRPSMCADHQPVSCTLANPLLIG